MKIGIKYCGGCNPRYDRSLIAARLRREFGGHDIVTANETETFDVVAVICGCGSQCADHRRLKGSYGKVVLTRASDYDELRRLILEYETKSKE